MRHLAVPFVLLAALATSPALVRAQAVADSSPFRPLDLPTPGAVRTGSGRPGAGYWQQRVDYRIRATLDSATHILTGRETIHYVNHSPDALSYLWMHVEQNICEPGSLTNLLDQPPLVFLGTAFDFSCQGFAGGLTLESITALGRPLTHTIFGTTMRVDLAGPLVPGGFIDVDVAWHFPIPPFGAGRMGRDGELYEIAQWYPRMAVYDDVKGWNHEPYIGAGEFYLEYGSFDVALTVPASFIVSATGTLRNPLEVLTAAQRTRLVHARTADSAVAIITEAEAGHPALTRPRTTGNFTWRFHADSVRDFAFAAAPHFQWDASGWHGILIHTYYRPGAALWKEANTIVRDALRYYSQQWYPYPYAHMSSIEGPIEGMEYPMMTFDPAGPTRIDLQWVLAHELGHQWMPMIVGSNERLYPWMDEGFNTFIDLGNAANYFRGDAYGDTIETHPLRLYPDHAIPGVEQPMIARPVEVHDLFWAGYQKPALMMQLLRREVLGMDRFDPAFRAYLKAWAFKHPTPADFIRTMRDQTGTDLDWFFREWIYTTARLDQAVDSVTVRDDLTEIFLSNHGQMVMPTELGLRVRSATGDNVVRYVRLPVEMWNLGDNFTYRWRSAERVVGVTVDPHLNLPDVNRANNHWGQ
ncbi:MAG: M1 family metallopeptidase [Gemmatimonadales bacterium]